MKAIMIFEAGSKILSELITWMLLVRILALLVILGAAFLIFCLIKFILKGR